MGEPCCALPRPLLRLIRPSHVEAWVKSMTVAHHDPAATAAPGTIKTRFVNVRGGVPGRHPRRHDRRRPDRQGPAAPPAQARGGDGDPDARTGATDPRGRRPAVPRVRRAVRLRRAAARGGGGAQVGDVDFLRRRCTSPTGTAARRGKIEIRLPKYNSERTVHVPDALLEMLSEHVGTGPGRRVAVRRDRGRPAAPEHRRPPVAHALQAGRRRRASGCTTCGTSTPRD